MTQAFMGLWCYADREGRFEWKPRTLKSDVLPYWDGDMGAVLEALASKSFVIKYVVDGNEYGYIRNWHEHQRIDHRETASVLPNPAAHGVKAPCLEMPGNSEESPGGARVEGKGREGKGKERESRAHTPVATPVPEPPPGAGIRPVPLYRFPKDWKPDRQRHGDEAKWLRLSEKDIRDRAFHCKNKLYEHPFADPDDQFSRELNWCAKDKELQRSREQRKANPHGLDEKPGAKRRPGDKPSGTVFGG